MTASNRSDESGLASMFADATYEDDLAFTGEFVDLFYAMSWQADHGLDLNDLWWMEIAGDLWPLLIDRAAAIYLAIRDLDAEPLGMIAALRRENDIQRQWMDTAEWSQQAIDHKAAWELQGLLASQPCLVCGFYHYHSSQGAWKDARSAL